jgi:hypothetical protein
MARQPQAMQTQGDPRQANMIARQMVLERSIDMWQSISAQTLVGTVPGQVINVPLRNVGLIKRLVVEISGNIAQAAAETLTRTAFGASNVLSQVVLTDLSNQTRVNTTGWHLHALATARRQMAFGAAFTNDSPLAIGSNYPVMTMPASVTTEVPFRMFYEIPLAYGDYDLRGGIFASVVNATMNLQLTMNSNFVAASGANPTQSVYLSSAANQGLLSEVRVQVYQNYLDQLPQGEKGPILPILDLSTAYLLNNTTVSGLVANQDNAIPYANFRDFLSTFVIYDNFGTSSAVGTDVNTWSIQSANYTNIVQYDPFMSSLLTRQIINDDFPAAVARSSYYFDSRRKPISTVQFGNMQLIANLAQVQASTSSLLVGYEAMALINQITQAGSLYNT